MINSKCLPPDMTTLFYYSLEAIHLQNKCLKDQRLQLVNIINNINDSVYNKEKINSIIFVTINATRPRHPINHI